MPTYVEIAVNVPRVSGLFHYHLPKHLSGQVDIGHLVIVPFGKQTVQGVVLRFLDEPQVAETRAVQDLVDPAVVLTRQQLALAQELAEASLASLAECIALMLPPGLAQQADVLYSLPESPDGARSAGFSPLQARLLASIRKRGSLRGSQLDRLFPHVNWRAAARALVRRGSLCGQSFLPPPRVQPKFIRTAQLACTPSEAGAALPELGQYTNTVTLTCSAEEAAQQEENLGREGSQARARRKAILAYLLQHPEKKDVSEVYAACSGNLGDIQKLASLGLVAIDQEPSSALLRRQAMLSFLIREAGPVDVSWLYAESGGTLQDLETLAESELVVLGESEAWRNPLEEYDIPANLAPPLTRDQQAVWAKVQDAIRMAASGSSTAPILLHGVTGSGKTEIYLRAVAETIRRGKQTIVLVPEIALTPQTVRRFAGRFPGQVGLVHSGLSPGERYDTWRRARMGKLAVVVGPRSALFTPFANLGLIILDESHDESYYQDDPAPRYHARQIAVAYARLTGALCLLGTATPDITSTYQASQGRWRYLHLPSRILAHQQAVQVQLERLGRQAENPSHYRPLEEQAQAADLPAVQVVDMRQELKSGNRSIFSIELQAALEATLERDQQAILFLNRRGTATYVFCRDCGQALQCPNCDLPLTFHNPQSALICHYCGYQRQMPKTCPECGSDRIRQYGTGTERVESEVQELYPGVRTLRWDYETTRQKGAHEVLLSHFANHRADVLVGTQMLAKGLDLPLVTLVGVVLADVGLNLPDYRAAERTFQVLMQVAGRAGRSPLGGRVVLQTFLPEHYVIRAASRHDYKSFYHRELDYRQRLGYPPFTQLVRLEYRSRDMEQVEQATQEMAANIRRRMAREDRRATQMIGPAPCFFSRMGGEYRWQIVLRGPDPASLFRGRPLGEWRIEVNPPNLL